MVLVNVVDHQLAIVLAGINLLKNKTKKKTEEDKDKIIKEAEEKKNK